MKVKELIEELKKYDGELEISVWSQGMGFELEEDMIEQTEVEDEEGNIEKEIAIRC